MTNQSNKYIIRFMGRKKSFDTSDVLSQIGQLFIEKGYNGTSLDDIVERTGLLRGSLYATFGSKQGMFISALKLSLEGSNNQLKWGLLIVAMLEVTSRNTKVYDLVQTWYTEHQNEQIAEKIGLELLKHSGLIK
ncbi:MAG: helix-turn-helix domain-containing protein [Liquorilactobacillus hordei]|uniref:TetR/AcrR family transcriptional regulator n=1 Tax=Liquorilactobacillus hordei TaxID=468911 RepID=UPI0039EAF86D